VVVQCPGENYLVEDGSSGAGTAVVGNSEQSIEDDSVQLILVRTTGGGGSGSTLRWRGEWSADASYTVGDIVIVKGPGSDGELMGTYHCKLDAPQGSGSPATFDSETVFWERFASGSWRWIQLQGVGGIINIDGGGYSDADEDAPLVTMYNGDQDKGFLLRVGDCAGTDGVNRILRVREIDICENGVQRKMLIVASEVYDA
jgi:hypothetical protein